jgi:hypothetical protein
MYCKNCRRSFVIRNKLNKIHREQKWFRDWIIEGYSVRQLNNISKHSKRTLKNIISYWLKTNPPEQIFDVSSCRYLVSDGTYLKHEHCIYAVTDYQSGLTVKYDFGDKENYAMAYMIFSELKAKGCRPKSITIDGNTTVIKALREVWPDVLIQRCLYHILRQGISWLRRFPRDLAARELRKIILTVMTIKDDVAKQMFLERLATWEEQFGNYVKSLDGHHKVYGDIQRARALVMRALPDMFHFLTDSQIPSTSNSQEGLFSSAKILFRNHRGVNKKNRDQYFSWYFYFKNQKILKKKQPKGY